MKSLKLFSRGIILSSLLIFQTALSQDKTIQKPVSNSSVEIGRCLIKSENNVIQNVKVQDLINWVEHPPFMVDCEDKKSYSLKSYELTFLTLKPFANQSYGVGDAKMIPILARKAMEKLKAGDTVILKSVVLTDSEGKEAQIPTLSIKITE